MSVYVDDMRARYGRLIMCHMVSDTDEELHAMADKIGVARKWWQGPPKTRNSHYDICLSKRAAAVSFGAQEITRRQSAEICKRNREVKRAMLSFGDHGHTWFGNSAPRAWADAASRLKDNTEEEK